MYSPAALDLFGQVKACFDPDNLLNPGVLVDPRPVDADLRTDAVVGRMGRFADGGAPLHRGRQVPGDNTPGLGVMCPSYLATRQEQDSTRGRARVLQEMINGERDPARLAIARGAPRARPLPVLQGLRPRLPDRDRHGRVQGRGAGPHVPGPAPAPQPLRARLAAALGAD